MTAPRPQSERTDPDRTESDRTESDRTESDRTEAADADPVAAVEALAARHRDAILALAAYGIDGGLAEGAPPTVSLAEQPADLAAPGASFVTLEKAGRLRGCIGSLEARRPLAEDLVANGFAAAFRDPRFPPLDAAERAATTLSVSLLTPPAPIEGLAGEADLIDRLVPGEDGLILAEPAAEGGGRRGTFLPQVWETLPEPARFLAHLKEKAGLPADHWSETLRVWRYRAVKVG